MSLGSYKYWQSATAVPLPFGQGRQFYYLDLFHDLRPSIPFILPQHRPHEQLPLRVQITRAPYEGKVLSMQPTETQTTVNHQFSVPLSILWLHECMVNAFQQSHSPQYSPDWCSGVWLALPMSSDQDAVTRGSNGPLGERDRSFSRSQWWTEHRSGRMYTGVTWKRNDRMCGFYQKLTQTQAYFTPLLRTSHGFWFWGFIPDSCTWPGYS